MKGTRLKYLRNQSGLTQQEIADKLGISRANYSHIENERNEPDNATLVKIAHLFDVSTDYLLGNTDKKHYYDLSEKEKVDLGKLADELLEGSTSDAESDFYGEPSTDEQKASLRAAILTALEMNKSKAKKKFTPKKYRDSDN